MTSRIRAFAVVGAIGFVLQLALLHLLVTVWDWSYLVATAFAVEAAVLNNFVWHERWTWRDRIPSTRNGASGVRSVTRMIATVVVDWPRAVRLLRFHISNGATSVAGNLFVTAAGVELLRLPAVAANALAVAIVSAVNFVAADRWVFANAARDRSAPRGAAQKARLAIGVAIILLTPAGASAQPEPRTLAAWSRYVAGVESSWQPTAHPDGAVQEPVGEALRIDGGTINRWRGSVLLRGTTVERLVHALQNPGLPPPAEDILDSRVLYRDEHSLRVYMKLVRTAIITVTYDTEHDVTFKECGQGLATSRSVATSIREAGDDDRGFLWRLNSYWTYRQVGLDVRVDLLSLSLSRSVPALVRPIAMPIVGRIARESTSRALEALRRFGEGQPRPGARTSTLDD